MQREGLLQTLWAENPLFGGFCILPQSCLPLSLLWKNLRNSLIPRNTKYPAAIPTQRDLDLCQSGYGEWVPLEDWCFLLFGSTINDFLDFQCLENNIRYLFLGYFFTLIFLAMVNQYPQSIFESILLMFLSLFKIAPFF